MSKNLENRGLRGGRSMQELILVAAALPLAKCQFLAVG